MFNSKIALKQPVEVQWACDRLAFEDDTATDLAGLHAVVDGLEVLKGLDRDLGLHLAARGKVERFNGVLAVSDVGA